MTSWRTWLVVVAAVLTAVLAWLGSRGESATALAAGLTAPFVVPALWVAALLVTRRLSLVAAGAFVTIAVSMVLAAWPLDAVMAGFVVAGVVGGWALGRRWRVLPVLGVTALCLVPGFALEMAGTSVPEVFAEFSGQLRDEYEAEMPADLSLADRQAALTAFDRTMAGAEAFQRRLWPSTVAVGLLGSASIVLALGWLLARLFDPAPPLPAVRPFVTWRAPFATVWVLIGGLALALLGGDPGELIGWNVVLAAAMLLAAQGLAVQAWLVKQVLPPLVQMYYWVVGALLFAPLLVGGGALIGLVDQWFDLRKRRLPPGDGSDET